MPLTKGELSPLLVKPREAQRLLGCSHKRLYALLADGALVSFKDGRSRKITLASLNEYVARGDRRFSRIATETANVSLCN